MKRRAKYVLFLAAAATVAAAVSGCSSSTSSSEADPSTSMTYKGTIKIDIVSDFTGTLSSIEGDQGALAYFDQVNAQGGVDGYKIVVHQYDGAGNPDTALQAVRSAIADNPAAILTASAALSSALPAAAASGIPTIGDGSDPGWTGHPNLFSPIGDVATFSSDTWVLVLKHYAGAKKVAILTAPLETPDAMTLAKDAAANGMQVVLNDDSTPEVANAAQALSVAEKVKASGATAVMLLYYTPASELQADLNSLPGQHVTVLEGSESGPAVLSEFGTKIDGEYDAEDWPTAYVNNAGINLYKADMDKYGYGSLVYTKAYLPITFAEAMMLVNKGLEPAGAPFGHSAVVAALEKIKNYTADGLLPDISYPKWQNYGSNCGTFTEVVNGQWVPLTNGAFPFFCGAPSTPA